MNDVVNELVICVDCFKFDVKLKTVQEIKLLLFVCLSLSALKRSFLLVSAFCQFMFVCRPNKI